MLLEHLKKVKRADSRRSDNEGFQFLSAQEMNYDADHAEDFFAELDRQKKDTFAMPTGDFKRITVDGEVEGTKLRLSEGAFSDLCRIARVNSKTMNRLVQIDPDAGLAMMSSVMETTLQSKRYRAVVDRRHSRIDAVVGNDFQLVAPADHIGQAIAFETGMKITRGTIRGRFASAAFVSPKSEVTVDTKRGDVMQFGAVIRTAADADASLSAQAYLYRLRCLNGAMSEAAGESIRIPHRGDDFYERALEGVVGVFSSGAQYVDRMKFASQHLLDISQLRQLHKAVIAEGGEALAGAVIPNAKREAEQDGLAEGDMSLFNYVNGITYAGHTARNEKARSDVETLGLNVLRTFSHKFSQN